MFSFHAFPEIRTTEWLPILIATDLASQSSPSYLRLNKTDAIKYIVTNALYHQTKYIHPASGLKIGNPSTVTPITLRTPSQRLILRPSNLPRLGILVALEFRPGTHARVGMESFALTLGGGRLIDLGGAEGAGRLFLEFLEHLLLFFGERRGCWTTAEHWLVGEEGRGGCV